MCVPLMTAGHFSLPRPTSSFSECPFVFDLSFGVLKNLQKGNNQ